MTSFSVVVTAQDAQGHLREGLEALRRCGAEPAVRLQVVVVDNGSADSSRAIAEEYAGRDARFRTVHLPDRLPPGRAREAGAARADGEYLLFLDGRDTLLPGALQALAERIEETGEPDLVLFDHIGSHWQNPAVPSEDGALFAGPGRRVFTAAAEPGILKLTATPANRAVRAGFYAAHRELFTAAGGAEVLPALGSLLAAQRIAVLDEVCLRRNELGHRRRPEELPEGPGEILPGQLARSLSDLLDQYERLWELLAGAPASDARRSALFHVMVGHYLRAIGLRRLPERDRAEFFGRASQHFNRYKPAGYRRAANLDGLRHAVLERGSLPGYRALQSAGRRRRTARVLTSAAKRTAGRKAMEAVYREQLRRPLDTGLAVFSAYWDRGVACSPGAISAKLAELAPHIRQVWLVRASDVPLLPAGTDYAVAGSPRYWSVLARAKYLVNNVNFPDELVKRRGQVHIQTHHGTPLKRMGVDQIPYPATSRGVDYEALLERCARWDYSVSANRHSTEIWERAYPVPFTSLDYGYPRNDVYHTATAADVLRIRERLGLAPGRKALLYAPTHRDYEASWTPRLDLERLARTLGEEFVLLVRGHYFYDRGLSPLEKLHRRGLIIDVSRYESIEELALASDGLITDYSSVMFDYANLDRPIVVFADDWETYAVTRGVYFDIGEHRPGPVVRSQRELEEVFASGAWQDEAAAADRAAFRRRFCEFDDGHAAERVVRHVFLGESGTPPVVPIEQRTPAPAPDKAAAALP